MHLVNRACPVDTSIDLMQRSFTRNRMHNEKNTPAMVVMKQTCEIEQHPKHLVALIRDVAAHIPIVSHNFDSLWFLMVTAAAVVVAATTMMIFYRRFYYDDAPFFVHRRFYEHFFFLNDTQNTTVFLGPDCFRFCLRMKKKTTLVLIKFNRLQGFVWKSLDVRITYCAVAMVTDNIWWYHSYQQLLSLFPIFWILLIFLPTAFAIWLLATDMDGEMPTFYIGVFFNFMEYNRCCETNQTRCFICDGFFGVNQEISRNRHLCLLYAVRISSFYKSFLFIQIFYSNYYYLFLEIYGNFRKFPI